MNGAAILDARSVHVTLGGQRVLENVTVSMKSGSVVGLVGPNGAGKTTLLRAMAGLVPLAAGTISINGRAITTLSRAERAKLIGYLPQDRAVHWPLSVRRIVELGRLPHLEPWRAARGSDAAAVQQALRDADILPLADRSVSTLSGGEAARVAIARMLAGKPQVILADEPTAGLDPAHKLEVLDLFRRLADEGCAVVTVLHDLTLAARYCDRIVVLSSGRMNSEGAPHDVLSAPLLSAVFGIDAKIANFADTLVILPWTSRRAGSPD